MSQPPLIDDAVLDELIATIGPEAARSVFDLFREETQRFIDSITTAPEPDVARRAAHSLRSSAGQLGAAALAAIAGRVEALATAGDDFRHEAAALAGCAAQTQAMLAIRLRPPPM